LRAERSYLAAIAWRRLDHSLEVGLMRARAAAGDARRSAGAVLPVLRTRCISLIAADGPTAKRRAAARIGLPRSTAPTILRLRSNDIGASMAASPAASTFIVESSAPMPSNRNMI
jgi:hypothetical protein